jgi:hypothetical protein
MKARNTGDIRVTRPYNDQFYSLIIFLKQHNVNFIPSDIYSLYVPKLVPGRRVGSIMKTSIMDVRKFDKYHQIFIDKLFDDRYTFNLQSANPNMEVSKIQTFWKKNKTRKSHKLFKNDALLSRYTSSTAITDVLNNLDKLRTTKMLKTQKETQQSKFDRDIHDINTRRTLEIENRRKDYLAAKKIQRLFKTYKNKKRNSINSSSRKRKSSAAKKIQRKFRSFTQKRK